MAARVQLRVADVLVVIGENQRITCRCMRRQLLFLHEAAARTATQEDPIEALGQICLSLEARGRLKEAIEHEQS